MLRKFLLALALTLIATVNASANITRTRIENFSVEPGVHIDVKINGGSIAIKTGSTGQVHVELIQVADTNSEKEADELIAKVQTIVEKTAQGISIVARSESHNFSWLSFGSDRGVHFSVNLIVPAKVDLNLDTSGGSIKVDGEIQGELRANTSGGPIAVTGGTGNIDLDTSGGSISVDHVVQQVHANTSGGSIHIGYVSPSAIDVNAYTSGGEISIGLDPAGNYDLQADTSGGNVIVKDLAFNASRKDRTHAEGKINQGGTHVHADTSGGNVDIHAAHP